MQVSQSRGNILYVDDEESNLFAFVASFRKFYDNIYTATSAHDGIEILRHHPVDVVLTDQRMPGMTGVQFLETIIAEFPDTIRMIVTGFSDIDAVIKAINSGHVFRYVQKPWDQAELKLSIDQAIKIHQLERVNRHLIQLLQNEIANKDQIVKVFQEYVPANIVTEVLSAKNLKDMSDLSDAQNVTVLFSDARGFAALTLSIENPTNAIYCALDMVSMINKFNETYQAKYGRSIEMGILITQTTYDEVKDQFECEALGPQFVNSNEKKIHLYRVIKPVK